MTNKNNLKHKWFAFKEAALCPVPIFSFFGAIALIALSVYYKDKIEFSILIYLIGSLLVGIWGAFIKSGYDELTQDSILTKKGQSAVRNLSSIEQQIIQTRKWIRLFLKEKTTKKGLEEIDRHLITAEMNIKSGLEDWIDVIPELKEQKDKVKNYWDTIGAYDNEILKNKRELIKAGKDEKLKKQLKKHIKDLQAQVEGLKENQPSLTKIDSSKVFGNNDSIVSPCSVNLGSLDMGAAASIGDKVCSNCGKRYKDNLFSNYTSATISSANLCPDCRKK